MYMYACFYSIRGLGLSTHWYRTISEHPAPSASPDGQKTGTRRGYASERGRAAERRGSPLVGSFVECLSVWSAWPHDITQSSLIYIQQSHNNIRLSVYTGIDRTQKKKKKIQKMQKTKFGSLWWHAWHAPVEQLQWRTHHKLRLQDRLSLGLVTTPGGPDAVAGTVCCSTCTWACTRARAWDTHSSVTNFLFVKARESRAVYNS